MSKEIIGIYGCRWSDGMGTDPHGHNCGECNPSYEAKCSIAKLQKNELRENMTMKTFNFYLDDVTKLQVLKRLRELGMDQKKGTMSALIRVLLTYFTELIDDDPTLEYIIRKVNEEYVFTTKKNKRSSM